MYKYCKSSCIFFIAFILLTGCKKSGYLTDEGVHNPKTSLSTYEYLKQHPYHLFDTLIMMVDHYNLKEDMNDAGTVFAVTNYSITRFVTDKGGNWMNFPLDSVYKYVTEDSIRQYFLTEKVRLADFTNEMPQMYANKGNTVSAVRKILTQDPTLNQWSGAPVFFLYYVKVYDGLDNDTVVGRPDRTIRCQTSGIETASGGVLHVLDNTHSFSNF